MTSCRAFARLAGLNHRKVAIHEVGFPPIGNFWHCPLIMILPIQKITCIFSTVFSTCASVKLFQCLQIRRFWLKQICFSWDSPNSVGNLFCSEAFPEPIPDSVLWLPNCSGRGSCAQHPWVTFLPAPHLVPCNIGPKPPSHSAHFAGPLHSHHTRRCKLLYKAHVYASVWCWVSEYQAGVLTPTAQSQHFITACPYPFAEVWLLEKCGSGYTTYYSAPSSTSNSLCEVLGTVGEAATPSMLPYPPTPFRGTGDA